MRRSVKHLVALLVISGFAGPAFAIDKRTEHFISIPFIEGTGIYTSVMSLRDAENTNTRAAAIVNLSLLATQGTVGSLMAMNLYEKAPVIRTIHRIIAYSVVASGIWLAASTSFDKGTRHTSTQYVSYAYPVCASFPIILFTF